MSGEESRLRELLADEVPAQPDANLVDRIMDGIPVEAAANDGVLERFNAVAWPLAGVSVAAAVALWFGVLRTEPAAVADPVASITSEPTGVEGLIAISR